MPHLPALEFRTVNTPDKGLPELVIRCRAKNSPTRGDFLSRSVFRLHPLAACRERVEQRWPCAAQDAKHTLSSLLLEVAKGALAGSSCNRVAL